MLTKFFSFVKLFLYKKILLIRMNNYDRGAAVLESESIVKLCEAAMDLDFLPNVSSRKEQENGSI
jgi:hypothetical protein